MANIMEIELRAHLLDTRNLVGDAAVTEGTQRSYPDLEFSGRMFGGSYRAVDIKCARRDKSGTRLNNRIALYTGTHTSCGPSSSSPASSGPSVTIENTSLWL